MDVYFIYVGNIVLKSSEIMGIGFYFLNLDYKDRFYSYMIWYGYFIYYCGLIWCLKWLIEMYLWDIWYIWY